MRNPKVGQTPLSRLANTGSVARNGSLSSAAQTAWLQPGACEELARELSITTVEEFYAWTRTQNPARVETFAGNRSTRTDQTLAKSLEPFVSPEFIRRFDDNSRVRYSCGARLSSLPTKPSLEADVLREAAHPLLPNEISLINTCMPPIKDQGERPTSVAFATCTVIEYAVCRRRGQMIDLSEQWQYWNCKQHDGNPTSDGTSLALSFYLAARDGICEERDWPYVNTQDIADLRFQQPPPIAISSNHKVARFTDAVNPRDVVSLKQTIANDQLIAIAIPWFDSVDQNLNIRTTGNILVPATSEPWPELGHALVLVGYVDDSEFAVGGYFIVRTSWGNRWGRWSLFGPGYGTIPYRFIELYNHSAFTVTC